MKEDTWFVQHRQEWIAEMLRIYGFINRAHLIRKFQISTAQAAVDIGTFLNRYPKAVHYNRTTKRYEATAP